MDCKIDAIKENYRKNMKAHVYVDKVQQDIDFDTCYIKVPLRIIYNVLQSGRFKGSKLLELGSGPIVPHVASASAFYPNIIMSDYVEDFCEELKLWLKGESNLKQFLEYPAELEGYSGNLEAGKQLLEKRIRECVKQVVRGDIMDDNIFLEEVKPEVAPPYDLITALWCLDAVPPDFDSFVLVLKRIYKLLRPGGGLIFTGDFEEGNWRVGEKEYHNLELSENEIKKAVKESGFRIVDMKVAYREDALDYYCVVAEKPFC